MSIRITILTTILFGLLLATNSHAQENGLKISSVNSNGAFPLAAGKASAIYVDGKEAVVVQVVADAFAKDVEAVTNLLPVVKTGDEAITGDYVVIAGTLGTSALIDKLSDTKKIVSATIISKWEAFSISVVQHPFKNVKAALVIAGSDSRGTAFGLFQVSRLMGVQPYYWWADIRPQHQNAVYIPAGSYMASSPSVKYRGIFLNDEDWGLQPWAATHLDTDIKDIGPKTYEKVFELLLRLKANYIWPAMHECTKAFWYYKGNPKVAEKWGIFLGASHCEPMLRNNVFEWSENYTHEYGTAPGEWRYDINKTQIFNYWDDRAKESKNNNAVYTVGMRGIHDGSMPGPNNVSDKIKLLEKVITDQRLILSNRLAKDATAVPQIFCPYKEVLNLYQQGMNLPDDVTIAWADDNNGYIRQLSNPTERKRSGGSGVYYHLSYWGAPRDYLWLSSNSPALVSYEMSKAWHYGADKLWVVNVGDIKPAELETQFFLDLAWDAKTWTPNNTDAWLQNWAAATFGQNVSTEIADIKKEYYRLAAAAKPEQLDQVSFTPAEEDTRIIAYQKLKQQTQKIRNKIGANLQDAYYELIEYSVEGAALMNEKILFARKSLRLAAISDKSALKYSDSAKMAYQQIAEITQKYNTGIAAGKWNGMMNWHPRDQRVFEMPEIAIQNDLELLPDAAKPVSVVPQTTIINAADFINSSATNGSHIEIFNGLGISGKSIGVLPLNDRSYGDAQITSAPYADYKVNLSAGAKTIVVKCLPGFRIYDGLGLRYAISVNSSSLQIQSVSTKAETKQWAKNVMRGYASGETNVTVAHSGETTVRIYFLDPGVVISNIEITFK